MSFTHDAAHTNSSGHVTEFDSAYAERERVGKSSRYPLSAAVVALGAISLVSDIIGIAQWPQTPMVWIMIVTGGVALLFGLPAVWICHIRAPRTLRTDALLVSAVILSLVGACFVTGGVVALGHGPLGRIAAKSDSGGVVHFGSGTVRREGTVSLLAQHQIDLDSTDPAWGVIEKNGLVNTSDLLVDDDSVTAINGAQIAVSDDISYKGCRGATGYGDKVTYANNGISAEKFCVKTNANHYAAVRVTGVTTPDFDPFSNKIEFSVTVW